MSSDTSVLNEDLIIDFTERAIREKLNCRRTLFGDQKVIFESLVFVNDAALAHFSSYTAAIVAGLSLLAF